MLMEVLGARAMLEAAAPEERLVVVAATAEPEVLALNILALQRAALVAVGAARMVSGLVVLRARMALGAAAAGASAQAPLALRR